VAASGRRRVPEKQVATAASCGGRQSPTCTVAVSAMRRASPSATAWQIVTKRIQRSWPDPGGRLTLRFRRWPIPRAVVRRVARASWPWPFAGALLLACARQPGGFYTLPIRTLFFRGGISEVMAKTSASTAQPALQGQTASAWWPDPWGGGVLQAIQPQANKHRFLRQGRSPWPALQGGDIDGDDRRHQTCSAAWPQPQRKGLVPQTLAFLRALRDRLHVPQGRLRLP